MDDEIEKRRRLKIESRMSEEDRKESQQLEQQANTESDYKLLKMKNAKKDSYKKTSVYAALLFGVVTAIIQMLGFHIPLVPIWIRDIGTSNNDLLADLIKTQETLSKLYKYGLKTLEYAEYFSTFLKGIVISMTVFTLITW